MRKGSILLIMDSGRSFFERKIEKLTGDCHHVAIYVGGNTVVEALLFKGVVTESISKYIHSNKVVIVYEPREEVFSNDVINDVVNRAMNEVGKKYSKLDLLAKLFPLLENFNTDNTRICSELIGYAWSPYHEFLNKDYKKITPNDIRRDGIYSVFKYFDSDILGRKL